MGRASAVLSTARPMLFAITSCSTNRSVSILGFVTVRRTVSLG